MNAGLRPTPPDERDYALGSIVILPALSTLPETFTLPYTVKNQRDSDFCSAYMTCAMSEVQEGIELEPAYSFAVSKEISGDVDSWGQDLRSACKAHIRGALPAKDSPYNLSNQTQHFLRRLVNWQVPEEQVLPYRKQTYFKVTGQYVKGPYDHFDNIRASLHKFASPVGIGVMFSWPLSQIVLDTISDKGFGHAMTVVGFTRLEGLEVCTVLNSAGEEAGKGGVHYMTREVLNHFVDIYGAYMFTDIPRADVEYALETGTKIGDNWVITLIRALINLFRYHAKSKR